jgi:hypothetical protein
MLKLQMPLLNLRKLPIHVDLLVIQLSIYIYIYPYAFVIGRQLCYPESLDPTKVRGKIVYCLRGMIPDVEKSLVVAQAGGVGMILADQSAESSSMPQGFFVPTSIVSAIDGLSVLSYIYSTK